MDKQVSASKIVFEKKINFKVETSDLAPNWTVFKYVNLDLS